MTIFARVKRLIRSQFASHERYQNYRKQTSYQQEPVDVSDAYNDSSSSDQDPELAKHYQLFELPYGSDFEQVRSQYKDLMKRYHPDKFYADPSKQAKATEYVKRLNQAYSALSKHLDP